jgi:hypothetical protein
MPAAVPAPVRFIGPYHQLVERHNRNPVMPDWLTLIIRGARVVLMARGYHVCVRYEPATA